MVKLFYSKAIQKIKLFSNFFNKFKSFIFVKYVNTIGIFKYKY